MRLDHLLSKEEKVLGCYTVGFLRYKLITEVMSENFSNLDIFGDDALRENTRSHFEHDGYVELLEHCLREELNADAQRRICATGIFSIVLVPLNNSTAIQCVS